MLFQENKIIQSNDDMIFHPYFNVFLMSSMFRGLLHQRILPYISRDDE